jgi:hypothetical protein
MWIYRFLKRLPQDLFLITRRTIQKDRYDAEDIGLVQQFFDQLEPHVKRIPPSNIYNFDETGFRLGEAASERVVTAYPNRSAKAPVDETSEGVTVIECVAANGDLLPPYIILKGKVQLERWYTEPALPKDYRVAVSPSGWTNDELALDWVKFFEKNTRKRAGGGERLLLFDGHGSHLTFEFLSFCQRHKILCFCFVSHTTHFAQPLDQKPFLALKKEFRRRNTESSWWGCASGKKEDFLREIDNIRQAALKNRTIRHAFSDTGIWPFEPLKVIQPMRDREGEAPELQIFNGKEDEQLLSSSVTGSPPRSAKLVQRTIQKIDQGLENEDLSPKMQRRLSKLCQFYKTTAEQLDQANCFLQETLERKGKMPKKRPTKRTLKTAQPLGPADANRRIKTREDEEEERAIKRARRQVKKTPGPTIPAVESEEDEALQEGIRMAGEPYRHVFFYDTIGAWRE